MKSLLSALTAVDIVYGMKDSAIAVANLFQMKIVEMKKTSENICMVCECPHCDGNKIEIDDNDPNGTKTCYYCDGKGWVSYDEAEAYREHDPNLM